MKVSHGAKKLNVKVKEQKNGDLDFVNEWWRDEGKVTFDVVMTGWEGEDMK